MHAGFFIFYISLCETSCSLSDCVLVSRVMCVCSVKSVNALV